MIPSTSPRLSVSVDGDACIPLASRWNVTPVPALARHMNIVEYGIGDFVW